MKTIAALSLLAVTLGPPAAAAGLEDQVRTAEADWARAVLARDLAALERIFAPALIYAHASGAIETRQQYIDRLRTGKQRYDSLRHEIIKVVLYGDAAVAHSLVRVTGVNDKGPFNDHVMMMHLWAKQGGAWRLAAHQTTKIP